MNNHAVAKSYPWIDRDVRIQLTIAPDAHSCANHTTSTDPRRCANLRAFPDYRSFPYRHAFPKPC